MISLFDLFKIGIGPSSSHTVGPMLATLKFANELVECRLIDSTNHVQVELFGSLALTGIGHGTDRAVVLGLEGHHPAKIDPEIITPRVETIQRDNVLCLAAQKQIKFLWEKDLLFHRNEFLPRHPNGLRVTAFDASEKVLIQRQYYSVGGGFVIGEDETSNEPTASDEPFPFTSCEELLNICRIDQLTMAEVVEQNELSRMSREDMEKKLDAIWQTMRDCIERGCSHDGILPGGLNIRRRAPKLLSQLKSTEKSSEATIHDPLLRMDWVTMFALAVNEENAAGGRVVTAPTNGAAGVIPLYSSTTIALSTVPRARACIRF